MLAQAFKDLLWFLLYYGEGFAVYYMLFLYSEEVPHASSEDLDESGEEGQEGRFRDQFYDRRGDSQGPRAPKDQIHQYSSIVNRRRLIAQFIS